MRRAKLNLRTFQRNFFTLSIVAFILLVCSPSRSAAQQGQKTFPSAQAATEAFVVAVKSNDEKVLLEILGPDGKEIVSSGDAAEDEGSRANFVRKYEEMHRLVKEPDGSTTLYIGAENWPTPIPLVNKGGSWYFDTGAGKQEILYRRVGRNEMSAIRVCQQLVAAQTEYFSKQNNQYAQKFVSDEGKHDGLYWPAADTQAESPVGPLVANAGTESAPVPFRGYYFRILTQQGKRAPSGAADYVVDGKMTAGFAFVAYPAEYGTSGVMTFIVGKDGMVYQRDLGPHTETDAKAMKAYNPGSKWQKAEEQQEQSADEQKTQ